MKTLAEKVYEASPAFMQSIYISIYGLKLYLSEYNKPFKQALDEFDKMQFFSAEEIKYYQNNKLSRMITHCYQNVPYYSKMMKTLKLTPDDIRSTDDLHKLPILSKKDVRRHATELKNANASKLTSGFTSGTSGSPLQLYYDNNIKLIKNVVDWRQKRAAGINLGDKLALFWGRILVPAETAKPPFWRTNYVVNHDFYSSYHLTTKNIECYLKQLRNSKLVAIEGYPSTIFILARSLIKKGETLPLRAAFTSSETIFPHQREAIEQAFECRVFDFYGLAERTVFATECERHEGNHFNDDFGITEILDKENNPLPQGETGRLVTTGLHNFGMPLLRYETNDVTGFLEKECSCGRSFPLMKGVMSRAEDVITTKDGRYLSFASLTLPFKQMKHIIEAQLIQENIGHIRIKLVKELGYSDADSQFLIEEFKKRIGSDTRIDIEFEDKIPRTKSGKYRFVISKVPVDF